MKTIKTTRPVQINDYPCFGGYIEGVKLDQTKAIKGYGKLRIRPIQLDDEEDMVRFHEHISEENIYMRYFQYMGLDRRTTHERLVSICTNTPGSYAVVMEHLTKKAKRSNIVAVGRLTKTSEAFVSAFDILFVDNEKTPQLGRILVKHLIDLACGFGFLVLSGEILVVDQYALNLCRELEFEMKTIHDDAVVQVKRHLVI